MWRFLSPRNGAVGSRIGLAFAVTFGIGFFGAFHPSLAVAQDQRLLTLQFESYSSAVLPYAESYSEREPRFLTPSEKQELSSLVERGNFAADRLLGRIALNENDFSAAKNHFSGCISMEYAHDRSAVLSMSDCAVKIAMIYINERNYALSEMWAGVLRTVLTRFGASEENVQGAVEVLTKQQEGISAEQIEEGRQLFRVCERAGFKQCTIERLATLANNTTSSVIKNAITLKGLNFNMTQSEMWEQLKSKGYNCQRTMGTDTCSKDMSWISWVTENEILMNCANFDACSLSLKGLADELLKSKIIPELERGLAERQGVITEQYCGSGPAGEELCVVTGVDILHANASSIWFKKGSFGASAQRFK